MADIDVNASVIYIKRGVAKGELHPDAVFTLDDINSKEKKKPSSAKAVFFLVASPKLFVTDCNSQGQMKLANALCRFKEIAD